MKRSLVLLIILLSSLGSGCSTPIKATDKIVYVTVPLPLPSRPALPTISANKLECLSDEDRVTLMNRDMARRQYAEELESIIKSTRN